MARGKKAASTLSPEEKLQQALVPVEEQPYPIPENWCWVKLEFVCSCPITDGTHKTPTYCEKSNGVPFVSAKDVTSGYIDWSNVKYIVPDLHQELYKRLAPQKDDILLAKNGTTGVAALVETNAVFDLYVTIAVLRPATGIILPQFLYQLINSPICKNQFNSLLTGIGVPNLHLRDIKNVFIPLPPLTEQRRIVSRIESLFSKLDEAKENAQAVVDSFELRKSAILHKAFTGELTEQWRKEHGVGLDSWKQCLIGEVFDLQAGKNISAKEISSQQTDLYRYPCFGGNGIRGYVEQFNREGEHPIIGRQGALCGNINLANNQFYVTEHAVVVSYKMDVSTSWAYHYLKFLNLNQYATATAQPGLAVSNIVKVPIQYVPFEEQQELSQILDDLLNKEQQAKKAAEAVLAQIDVMKKAILARAFRGELGTNDPADPPPHLPEEQ